ncbi:unnamed protein product [Adineta ricciae]|uniref:Uncharacterized protein n=1 Tax=Adineta ricciae TaxID=249248 RepID=A0A815PXX4_ADIRI|nr:unnamed protein product [Adineta ricciae]CAF1454779.1 unnamed protein product [Adineta ricciae]
MALATNITIWLDQVYDVNKPTIVKRNHMVQAVHISLCKVDPYIVTFRDADLCFNYIIRMNDDDKQAVLVISCDNPANLSKRILTQCQELRQIASVYVLSITKDESGIVNSSSYMPKLCGHFTDVSELCNQLGQLPYLKNQYKEGPYRKDFSINFFPEITMSEIQYPMPIVSNNSTRQEADFMYSSFLREILIKLDSTEEEMTTFCRQQCAGNEPDLNTVDEFEQYYDAQNAIFWYTRDTFLYRLLNQALRELNVDVLYSLRYFIKDLHSQLEDRHFNQLMSNSETSSSTLPSAVYRGQLMNNKEFDQKIRHNAGGFFSVSTFLSTTPHKNLAVVYAGDGSKAEECQSVLFEIEIDQCVNKFPYTDISQISAFGNVEGEILFTMGAVFRILSVDRDDRLKTWNVRLKLTGDEDDELRTLTEHMRDDIVYPSYPLASLAKLMMRMGDTTKAERYYFEMLEHPHFISDFRNVAQIYSNLGLIYTHINKRIKADEYFRKSVDILLQHLPETDPLLASIYNNLGESHRELGSFEEALLHYNKALKNYELSDDDELHLTAIGVLYNNIGLVYSMQHRYSEALQSYEKSLKIREKCLPPNHPEIATTYNNVGLAFFHLGDYIKAKEYYTKVLQMQQCSLPQDHPDFGRTYNNFPRKNFSIKTAVYHGARRRWYQRFNEPRKSDLLLGFLTPAETAV